MIQRNIKTSLPKQSKKLSPENKRKLQTAANDNAPASDDEWDNIRIAYNTEGLLAEWTDYEFKHWFARDVIPAAIEFLEKGMIIDICLVFILALNYNYTIFFKSYQ